MKDLNFNERQVNFVIDQETLNNLDVYCKTYGITRSKLIRRLIRNFLYDSAFPLNLRGFSDSKGSD